MFFIQNDICVGWWKSNSMPASAAIFLRYIRPCSCWGQVVATSALKCTGPFGVSIEIVSIGKVGCAAFRISMCRARKKQERYERNCQTHEEPGKTNSGLRIDDHDLRRKLSLWSIAGANPHHLALPQFADAIAAQGFHMDEDIRGIGPA